VVIEDRSDTWGHRVRSYAEVAGTFAPVSMRVVERGPVRDAVRVESRYGASTLVEEFLLARGATHVEVRVSLDWHERLKLLKLRVPTLLADAVATWEVAYGQVVRDCGGDEEPTQAWVDVSGTLPGGGRAGLALVNNGKHGGDVRGGDLGMTVCRSPVYAWHAPARLDPDGVYDYLDQGRQEFAYRIVPHAGDCPGMSLARHAAELNQPVSALLESFHAGDLPQTASFCAVARGTVVVTVVKRAERDAPATVIRAFEASGAPCEAVIEAPLAGRRIEAAFAAGEVKTFLLPDDSSAPVREVDLLEGLTEAGGSAGGEV
jgi:alpha-mannosidase